MKKGKHNHHLFLHNPHGQWAAQIGERNGFYGKKHSAEAKETMSQKAKGREPWNKGKPFKGAGMTGKRHSEETKKMALSFSEGFGDKTYNDVINNNDLYH